ncbi:PREDICTED: uncharacterized protein LOC109237941 [Nicotiana attenuata]|uniref:uncharacterized protein LOC109237941 n=1 Tax=Nicotiana attenuata TaxID=49451 RepID=UPI00090563E3|nr:PREDICTED: uncharacterized protein LOC109237941 [Nicotiana attenuata]
MEEFNSIEQFSTKDMYKKLMGDIPKVEWRKLVCNNQSAPKWQFILLLAAHKRLYTRDRLKKWGVIQDATCPMCGVVDESIAHLFYECKMSREVWQKLLQWQGILRQPMKWDDEIKLAILHHNRRNVTDEVYRMTIAGSVYQIWQERNMRVFQQKQRPAKQIVRVIIQEIFVKASMNVKIRKKLQNMNYYS